MSWKSIIPLVLVGLTVAAIAVVLVPPVESPPFAATSVDKPSAPDTSQGTCQQCHGASGAGREDTANVPSASPDTILFEEHFADGELALNWQTFPFFSPDLIRPVSRFDAPDGDGWVGLVTNETFGGFASLSYAGEETLADHFVEAWVYTEVPPDQQAPIHGIAVRVDPKGNRFYRLAAQFGAEPRISLAYVGRDINNFPDYLRTWSAAEIPGGAPSSSGWHRMGLRVEGDSFWAFWDDQELPGGAITDGRIENGYFGVYDNFVGGQQVAQTLVDAITVR
ncbi:MAG: hypothetical protein HYY30_08480 [Chloroflexi bacterium]|nr:hypothetical protein [Chloroflexota bacterium]